MAHASIHYEDLIGVPFVRGGVNVSEGLDCLGLALECFDRFGFEINLPEFDFSVGWQDRAACYLSKHAPRFFVPVEGDQWEVGDLVVTRPTEAEPMHLGVVVGPDLVLHTRAGVGVYTVSKRMFRPFALAAYRYRGRA